MPRYPKDLVELIAEKTHRYILRILFEENELTYAEINRELEKYGIRFKSTSSLTEALQRLISCGLMEKEESKYYLSGIAKQRWITSFLNLLIRENIDKGSPIRIE